jgi:UDP-glucose:(heptosyl)LPS alpha-1,3-glucosyltransferase
LEATKRLGGALKILAVGVNPDIDLLRIVDRSGLNDVVRFLGKIADVAPVYAAADCFVLPTRYDTFSLATLEAMASGLPVIVSRAAGVSELLQPGHDCFILENPDDVEELTHHLGRLVSDKLLRLSLGSQARKTAEQYSWEEVVARTLAVYREALADPR